MNKRITLFLFAFAVASAGIVEAQVLVTKNPALQSVSDIDPGLLDLWVDIPISRLSRCGDGAGNCYGVVSYRYHNLQPSDTGFSVHMQMKAEQAPQGTRPSISATQPGNIVNDVTLNFRVDQDVVGANAIDSGRCVVSDAAEDSFLHPTAGVFTANNINTAGGALLANSWSSGATSFGPNLAPENFLREIPTEWTNVMKMTCNAAPTADTANNAAQIALNALPFRESVQLVNANATLKYAARVANNSLWHFPMDGEPAIIDAEVGNGIADGEFYVDLTFSEGVYGATGVSRGAVAASALNIFRVDRAEFTNAAPTVSTAGTTFSPTRVTRPGGAALVGGDRVIRAHFASSNHPNVLHTASTVATLIAIRPAGTEAIYDANDNQVHGGSDDWYMQVLHDRHAPYISAAEVGPASTYIDLTFSDGVKFARTTSPAPAPADFKLTRYIGGGSSSATVTINSVTVEEGVVSSAIKVRLNIDSTGITSDDRMDIRIAEQVKEPTFPSLASVFTADPNSVKYDSSFPRTAAPAQIGSLQLMGKDRYSIRYTQSYITSDGSTLIADILSGNGATHSDSPLTVDEGDPADNPRGIVIEIRRTESDPDTITLRIARTDGDTDDGVSFRVQGEASDVVPSAVPVRFASNEMTKRVAIRVVGDDGPTGNREYTLTLETVSDVTQEINPSRDSVSLVIREDDDQTPPVVSDRGSLQVASFGATEATLTWQQGTDENNLRYTLEVTEMRDGQAAGIAGMFSFIRAPGASLARVEVTRSSATLIPGRTYRFALSVQDVFDNPTGGIAYTPVMQTMLTAFAAGERDRYVNIICSGGEFGDADGDGVPNNIENEIGSDCSDGSISRIGPADAVVPTITVNGEMIAAGAQEVLNGDYIIVPGTGERTGIDLEAATCAGAGGCAEDSVRAYANTSDCQINPGQARPGGDESVCPTSLSSFSNMLLWVGRDSLGNWISATSNYTVYVAPPVGFDVGVVGVDSGQMSVDLPISVAVSPGAGDFSIINDNNISNLAVSRGTLSSFDGLDQDDHEAVIVLTEPVEPILTLMEVSLIATVKVRAASDLSAPLPITAEQLSSRDLFSIGNASVMFIARPPETPRAVVASSSFRQTFSALFDDSDGQVFNRPETTSDDISVPGSTTARSGVYISDGSGIMLPSDSPPLSTEVTTAVGVDINIEVGVFDYAIDLSEPGDIAIALLRLSTVVQTPSVVYKYDPLAGSWGVFIATLITDGTPLVEGDTRHDRVYSAPAPDGQCPELSGSRQPDDDSSGGDHEYAWNLAVLGDNNVRVGDECLLMQIQDGSMNDADGAVEGTVFDPTGEADDDRGGGGGGGGGGAMSPIWLILLALAMMLPYGLRRRQSSPFISDL